MTDGCDGFMGRCEVVEPRRRGKRHWQDDVKRGSLPKACSPVSGWWMWPRAMTFFRIIFRIGIAMHGKVGWSCQVT